MSSASILGLHAQCLTQLKTWWPLVFFLIFVQVVILVQSHQLTRRAAMEAAISVSFPYVIGVVALGKWAQTSGVAESAPQASLTMIFLLSALVSLFCALVLRIIFGAGFRWALLSSLPLPLFVYFTGWVTLK